MYVHRVPANTASKFDVIYIFSFKIQRVQKNGYHFVIVYIIQIIDITSMYMDLYNNTHHVIYHFMIALV